VVVSLFSTNAFAKERAGSIGAYQRNREALQKLKEEDPKAAAELFSQGRALDPESGTLGFNEGSSRYRAGDFEESLHASEAAQARADQEGNPELYSASAYNRGAALEKLGKKEDAARAYLDGLRKAEAAKLTDLADELRRKLEQVQQDKKQQQQQQEDGEGGHPQQPQQQQQQQARRFRSDALTREDAERIMKELANREQGLREKLGKPKGRHGREQNLEKDW
jgi:tetratricopeptide (TPR) repeat protein